MIGNQLNHQLAQLPHPIYKGNIVGNILNHHTTQLIISTCNALICSTNDKLNTSVIHKSELDTHANMVVLGKECFVFETTGRTCNVEPFSSDLGIAKDVPIIDGALAYDCPYTHETYILIVRNTLHICAMDHNLIPPFIMREGGVIVNDIPKMHCPDLTIDDHCISFKDIDLRIPLQLNGVFSYFHTRKPLPSELYARDKVFITPDAFEWNPHCTSYAQN